MKLHRLLYPVVTALIALFAISALVAHGAPFGSMARTMIYVPQPPQHDIIPCGAYRPIARLDYWLAPGDTHYVARFSASGGPGIISFGNDTEQQARVVLPPNSPEQWYTLSFDMPPSAAAASRKGGSELGMTTLLFTTIGGDCTHTPLSAGVDVRSLNVWVTTAP